MEADPPIVLRDLLDALRAAVLDDDKDVATSALYAVAHLGSEADLVLTADRVAATSLPIASAAECSLSSLTRRFTKDARALAASLMKGPSFSVAAATILGALGAAGALDPDAIQGEIAFLSSCVSGGDARARRSAVIAVAEIGGVFATDILSFALADEEHDVQLAAARALGRVICVDPTAGRFLDAAPPSGVPSSRSSGMAGPRASATDVLDLIGRSGDDDLVAAAVNALGEGMTTWTPPSIPPPSSGSGPTSYPSPSPLGRSLRPSMMPGDDLIAALSPLAKKAPSAVAIAAVDALSRAPMGTPGREPALLGALSHPDPAVTKAAMLKIERTDVALERIARCLDHTSRDVRLLAAEMLTGASPPSSKDRLRKRATLELDPDVRTAIERALSQQAPREGEAPSL
jgi:HEAT repeat protein